MLDDCGPIWSTVYKQYYHDSVLRLGRLLVIAVIAGCHKSHPCLMCLIVDKRVLCKWIFRQVDVSDRADTCDLCNWQYAEGFMISRMNGFWYKYHLDTSMGSCDEGVTPFVQLILGGF